MPFIYLKYLDEDLTERKLFYTEDIVPTENDEELTYESSVTPTVESFIYGTLKKLYINDSKNKIPSLEDSNFAVIAGDVVVLGDGGSDPPVPPVPPVSNETKFYMNFSSSESPLTLIFMQTIDEDTTIDWGDGTVEIAKNNVPEGLNTSTSNTHIYENAGEYTITLSNDSGSIILDGRFNSNDYNIFHDLYSTYTVKAANIGLNTLKIGRGAFAHCTYLQSITISESVTEIGYRAFFECNSLLSITIPNSVTKIDSLVFLYCNSLQSITIPNGLTGINNSTFADCTSLKSVTIPNSVIEIGGSAFYNCTSLQSITVPDSVIEIDASAFKDCTSMQEYHFTPINPPSLLWSNIFENIPEDCIIYVPNKSVSRYRSAQYWSNYASHIQGE